MKTMLDNFINGNIKEAREQAKCHSFVTIYRTLVVTYGYTPDKALKTAHFLKTGEGWQQACDAI